MHPINSTNSGLKIAMVNTVRSLGGAARMASNLTIALNNAGTDIDARLYHSEDSEQAPPFHGLKKRGSRNLNALLVRLGGSTCAVDLGLADDLNRISEDADVLHIHNLHGYYLNYKKLLEAWRERPVVWTWHDMWGATGRCAAGYECSLWQSGCQSCPNLQLYPTTWIDNAASEFQRKQKVLFGLENLWIVSPSQWIADIAKTRGFDSERIKVIPNPVDSIYRAIDKVEARKLLGLPNDKFIALFIASDCGEPRKGYPDFAAALSGSGGMGIAVGKPPSTPDPAISHAGRVMDPALLNRYYSAADVMIIPSYADNYPTTVIEALMCGTPVIGYATGGIPSQLDLPFCEVVGQGDRQALRIAISQRIENGGKTDLMIGELAVLAQQRWSSSSVVEKYIDVYRQALYR